MEATVTQACLLKPGVQPQLAPGRPSRLFLKCSPCRTKAMAVLSKQCFSSEYCEPLRSWKVWLWTEKESKRMCTSGPPHGNPFVNAFEKAALLLYRAILLLGIGLGAPAPAMAKTASPPSSEVVVQKVIEKATQKRAASNITEKGATVESKNEIGPLLGEEFWKDMDLCKGSIITILKDVLDGDSTNRDALECLAKTLVENDDAAHALIVVKKLELLEPGELEWKYLKAAAYDMDGQFQVAKNIYQDILILEPFSSKAIQGLMMAMDELGESDAAAEVAEQAMVKAREEKDILEARNIGMLLGQYFMMKGHLHEALEHYIEMSEEDPKDFRPHLCQGIIYSAMGEKAKAEKRFKAYEKMCPKDYPERKYLDTLMLKAKQEGEVRFELKQQEKYVKTVNLEKGLEEESSDK